MFRNNGFDSSALGRIDEAVENAVLHGGAPGVVAAIATADAIHVAVAGAMSVSGNLMRRDTWFRITSMTKPMTAAVILTLVEGGMLELDAPVDALLPELANRRVLRRPDGPLNETAPAERPMTTRDLLTFTWGFGMEGAMFLAAEPW